ncbi:MAG: hypothetical protein LAT75_10725 [Candidatus Cyclonatronum sp.]|uniref:hypothetical protein n=1 Tax=Cyclonatronum sp. TaxID=3024185 RepID=UPI0025C3CB3F|nr:hypothetical protein [Cyclonatronum sp.]MCH8487327.1 hypothetical protein [Cyclonatronum sp.]
MSPFTTEIPGFVIYGRHHLRWEVDYLFIVSGINHFYNSLILKEYAHKKVLLYPKILVFLSGILLIAGGLSMITGYFMIDGMIALCIFMALLLSPFIPFGWMRTVKLR